MGYPVIVGGGAPPARPRSVTAAATLIFIVAGIMVANAASASWLSHHANRLPSTMSTTVTSGIAGVFGGIIAVVLVLMGYNILRGRRGWRIAALVIGGLFAVSSGINVMLLALPNPTAETGAAAGMNWIDLTRDGISLVTTVLWIAVIILLLKGTSAAFFPTAAQLPVSRLPEDEPPPD